MHYDSKALGGGGGFVVTSVLSYVCSTDKIDMVAHLFDRTDTIAYVTIVLKIRR